MGDDMNVAAAHMRELLTGMAGAEASDLHVIPGHEPVYRVHGRLASRGGAAISPDDSEAMISSVVPEPLRGRFENELDLDFSLTIGEGESRHRFRANVFRSQGCYAGCFRHIPEMVPSFEWMSFPKHVAEDIISLRNGLVIVTGITGSGKSTTLAGIVNLMCGLGGYRIITVEEPVEYLYESAAETIVTQREVGIDCRSFYDGLKYGLRQDPDVILVGEIRDRETAQMALSAAETGHLILTTMHTRDAKGAISRFVDLFDRNSQDDIRAQLSLALSYVIAQHLLPHVQPNHKRVLALETMVCNTPVRSCIKQGKLEAIDSAIQVGKASGMIRLDESLQSLLSMGQITYETARHHAKNPDLLRSAPHAG